MKDKIVNIVLMIVVAVIVTVAGAPLYRPSFDGAGVTHLSGLSVGEDGFAVTDGGTISLGSGAITTSGNITTTGTSTLETLAAAATVGTCGDATTTLFAILNPFAATSTVTFASLDVTNGTTTIDIKVGTSTTAFAPTDANLPTPSIINSTVFATSTLGYLVNGVTQSGIAGGQVGNGAARVNVGPGQYVLGQATSSYAGSSATGLQGITNGNNTFSCSYKVRWER